MRPTEDPGGRAGTAREASSERFKAGGGEIRIDIADRSGGP